MYKRQRGTAAPRFRRLCSASLILVVKGMEQMINEVLGKNIRKHRLSRNWTQERLADVLRVSHQVISKWENGIAAPDIETLCSLKQIFCISLDELCGITAEKADILIEEKMCIRDSPSIVYT